ncbi:MAG: LysR family transcriptional regulator [Pseudomonadota bacterium]
MRLSEKFDWGDLQLLLVIADTGYVADTASKLAIDPTTITRRLKRLEKKLGMKLVERIKGGVVLSEDCEKLVTLARSLDRELENAFPQGGESAGLHGTVRIAITDFLVDLIAGDLTRLRGEHAGLLIDISESYARHSLDNREADVAVRITEQPNEGLVGIRHEGLQFSLYGMPAFKRRPRRGGWPWISWNLPQSPHDDWIRGYDRKGQIVMRTGSVVSQAKFVSQGVGVAVLPDAYVRSQPWLADLIKMDTVWEQPIWVLTHAELRSVPRVQQTVRVVSASINRALSGGSD